MTIVGGVCHGCVVDTVAAVPFASLGCLYFSFHSCPKSANSPSEGDHSQETLPWWGSTSPEGMATADPDRGLGKNVPGKSWLGTSQGGLDIPGTEGLNSSCLESLSVIHCCNKVLGSSSRDKDSESTFPDCQQKYHHHTASSVTCCYRCTSYCIFCNQSPNHCRCGSLNRTAHFDSFATACDPCWVPIPTSYPSQGPESLLRSQRDVSLCLSDHLPHSLLRLCPVYVYFESSHPENPDTQSSSAGSHLPSYG